MYQQSTIRRARTILRNADAQSTARTQNRTTRKPAAKRDPNAWMSQPASKGQVSRINRAETALGLKPSPIAVIGTGGEARTLWQSLSADLNARGIRLA